MWQPLFALTNAVAVIGWLVLLLGPRAWLGAVRYGAVAMLCAIYAALFVGMIGGWLDPVRAPGAGAAALTDYSVRGLRALFASDGAIVIGWTHYLAFDLFVGCWIAEAADRQGVGRISQVPALFLTFMAGPIGLLTWFVQGRLVSRA
jgi:hypothetical protein